MPAPAVGVAAPPGLRKASLRTLATTLGILAATLVTSALSARQLGPDGRGVLAAGALVASLSAALAQGGVAPAVLFHRRRGDGAAAALGQSAATLAAIGLVALAVALGLQWGLARMTADLHTAALAVLLGAATAMLLHTSTMSQQQASLQHYNLARGGVPAAVLLFALATQLRGGGASAAAYLAVQLAASIVMLLWLRRTVHRREAPAPGTPALPGRTFWAHALRHHATVVSGLALINADKLFLLAVAAPAAFGFYALAYTTTRVLGALQDSLSIAIHARHAGHGEQALSAAVQRGVRLTFVPMLALAALVGVLAPWLVALLFGARFAPMALPMAVLAVESILASAGVMLSQRVLGAGRPGVMVARNLVLLPLLAAALVLLPAEQRVVGAAWVMLAFAALRLALALALFPLLFGEAVPRLWPGRGELAWVRSQLRRSA